MNVTTVNNWQPYFLANPVGIDYVIQQIQTALNTSSITSFLNGGSFGKAERQSKEINKKEYIYPAVFINEGFDYEDITGLDNKKAYCFFTDMGKEYPINYTEGSRKQQYEAKIKLHVWLNLNEINETKKYNYREEINENIKEVLSNISFPAVNGSLTSVDRVCKDFKDIFKEYSSYDLKYDQYLSVNKRYYGLSYEMTVRYFSNIICA